MALELEPGGVWVEQEEKWFQAVKVGIGAQVGTANEPWPATPLTTILHPHRPLSRTRSSQRASQVQSGRVGSGQLGSHEFSFPVAWEKKVDVSFPLKYFLGDFHEASPCASFLPLIAQVPCPGARLTEPGEVPPFFNSPQPGVLGSQWLSRTQVNT